VWYPYECLDSAVICLRELSGECIAKDEFDALCKIHTATNSREINSKESKELNAQILSATRKTRRIVS